MSRPNRIRKVGHNDLVPIEAIHSATQEALAPMVDELLHAPDAPIIPADWSIGALLNVRNHGDAYVITLYPEEFKPDAPERALRFTNPADCQNFVSNWYSRQHFDPRAR